MQRINSFKILNIAMSGFKCFRDLTEFECGDMTYVKGANGLGKSTIADAIAFAFAGASFFGEKALDKLHNPENKVIEVSVKLVDDNGEIHNLVRTRKKDITTITFDGYNLRQNNINEIFGERDLFLSMFNPLYFIETLGADAKVLLETMLPFVSHEAVLDALAEPLKSEMAGEAILSPETYIKNIRESIKHQESNLLYLQGQSDLCNSQVQDAKAAVNSITVELTALDEQIAALESERDASRLTPADEKQLMELYKRLDELSVDSYSDAEAKKLTQEIYTKELDLVNLIGDQYRSPYTAEIAQKDAALKSLYKDYADLDALIKSIQPGYKCPTCLHEISEDNLDTVKGDLQNKLKQCVEAGKKAKAVCDSVKEKEKSARQMFEGKAAKDTALLSEQLNNLKERYQTVMADSVFAENERAEQKERISNEVDSLEDRRLYGNLSLEEILELGSLRQKKRELEVQLEVFQAVLKNPGFKEQIADTEKEINMLKRKISNVALYIGEKNKLIFKGLNMNRVEIQLYEIIKTTGEIKDTFKFSYNGREYRRISLSEKVRAGLEVAELIKRLSGRDFPTFIDNGESICTIDNVRPTSQLFFALVQNGGKLSVTFKVIHREEAPSPAGAASVEGVCAEQSLRKAG